MRWWAALPRDGLGALADRLTVRFLYGQGAPGWLGRPLRLAGGRFVFRDAGELYGYVEVFLHHAYDRVPDFVPRDGWRIVDVGANVGCFAAYVCRRMRRGTLLAVEPNPEVAGRAAEHLGFWRRRRPALRIHLEAVAAGAAGGEAVLHVPVGGSVRASLNGEGEGLLVPVRGLDELVPAVGIDGVDLLKIDVEGSELAVLQGAERTLRHTARIVLEWHGQFCREDVRRLLEANGLVRCAAFPGEEETVGIDYYRRGARA